MSKHKPKSELKKVAVVTESPDDCRRTWDAVEYIMEPLEGRYDVTRLSVLDDDPKNGKQATKTEIKNARNTLMSRLSGFQLVILVGNTPLQTVTGSAGISQKRGKPIQEGNVIYLPMNNPGILRHDEKQEVLFRADMKLVDDIAKFGGVPESKDLNWRLVASRDDVKEMLRDLHGTVSYDIETTQLYPWKTQKLDKKGNWVDNPDPKIISVGFGTGRTEWCLPVNHPQSPWTQDEIIEIFEEINERRDDFYLVTHNGKFDLLWTWVHLGIKWELDFDTMLAHFMLDENSKHGLKYLAQVLCGAPDWEVDLNTKQGAANTPLNKHCKYLAHDVHYTRKLRYVLGKRLREDSEVKKVYDKIMVPCANLFIEIEYDGVFIDVDQFDEAEEVIRDQYDRALADLKKWEPKNVVNAKGKKEKFNWGSTKQLGKLLFEDLKIKCPEPKTKAGNWSCSESVIKRIEHPCTEALLKFREAKQQLSFFIDGWKPFLHKQSRGWYLHPSFKLHGTVTGRLSCEHPNLQQVPRDPRIRSLISAPKGWTLIQCDLSQAELRIAAELAHERNMIHAFVHGIDVHWLTAIREIGRGGGLVDLVIGTACRIAKKNDMEYSDAIELLLKAGHEAAIDVDAEWKEYRKKAKAVNFGYLYGMWWKKFKIYARDNYGVNVTDEEAEASRTTFFENYPDLTNWHKRQRRYARRHGYVKSLSGRKRRLPAARSANDTPERQAAERQAINSPVQSFANEINLMAALQLRKEYGRNVVQICGTVHDAVLFRVRNDMVEEVYNRMMEIMRWPDLMDEFDIRMSVPIEADGDIGPWGKGMSLGKVSKVAANMNLSIHQLLDKYPVPRIKELEKEAA
jgi:DNA polymerase I-like protein with 3'-5' exonuclease and polymerase domains